MEIIDWKQFLLPYEQTVEELMAKFKNIKNQYKELNVHSPIEEVEGRVKRVNSILDKLSKKNFSVDQVEQKLEDIAGIRIICRFVEDIEKVVKMLRNRDGFDLTINEERDYITNIKPSGYRSYHVLITYPIMNTLGRSDIKAEIQIRTISMDFWAKIEHSLRYKYSNHMPDDLQSRLISAAEAAFTLDNEMSTIRHEILEAQEVIKMKADLVEVIVENIRKLHTLAKVENINQINKDFITLYSEGSIEEFIEFDKQLKVMIELYKLEHM